METGSVIIVIGAVAVLCGVAVLVASTLFLAATVQKIRPSAELQQRIMAAETLVSALDAQVTKLRTQKAGRISNAKRVLREEQPEEDTEFDGLSADERALFQ